MNEPDSLLTAAYIMLITKKQTGPVSLCYLKAAALKQQISKFYPPQIQRTEASDHIYCSHRPFINVKASFCAVYLVHR